MLFMLCWLCQADNIYLTVGCCGLFTVLFILCLFNKLKCRTLLLPTVFLSAAVSCFILVLYSGLIYAPYAELSGMTLRGKFVLTEYPTYSDGRYYCISKYADNEGKAYKIRLSLPSVYEADPDYEEKISSAEPGDILEFTSYIYAFGGDNKEIKNNFKSKGLYLGAFPKGEIVFEKAEKSGLFKFLKREKKRTVNLLLSFFDRETASVGISLLTGDKNLLDNGTYETVKNAGVSHLFAVSGFHLSLWIMLVVKITESLGLSKRRWATVLLLFNLLVMFFASFSGSVLRAGIMMAVWLLGMFFKEDSDSLNSLGFSAAVILILNPFAAMNVSFLLSFVACYSIITVAVPIMNRAERAAQKLTYNAFLSKTVSLFVSAGLISAVVTVYTLPIMAYFFGSVSLMSVITNILLVPVASPIIVAFGLYVMLWFIPVLSDFLYGAAYLFTRYMLFCVNLTGSQPYGTASVSTDSFVSALLITSVLFAVPFVIEYYYGKKKINKLFKKSNT